MAQACLERITAAHASNCECLINSRVKFGSDGTVGFPAVPLACAQFARITQLMENRATQLCIATNLQLLMNLTHSTCGSDCVMIFGGIVALAHLICHLAVATPEGGPIPIAPGMPRFIAATVFVTSVSIVDLQRVRYAAMMPIAIHLRDEC